MERSQGDRIREIERLAQKTSALCQELYAASEQDSKSYESVAAATAWARSLLRSRARLSEAFPPGTFADPAFEIMLDLFVSEEDGKKVSVSAACATSGVPPTTALRWLAVLSKRGLIDRHQERGAGRRVYVTLTPSARETIGKWIVGAARAPANSP